MEPFINESSETDSYRKAAEFVRHFVEQSRDYREPHVEMALESRKLYETWRDITQSKVARANLKLPRGFTAIETQMPQITELFLKDRQLFRSRGQEPSDMVWEESLDDFHAMQLDKMEFAPKFICFVKAMLLDGTAIAKVPYRFEERETLRRQQTQDPLTGEMVTQRVPTLETLFDGPDLEVVNIVDFFPDWRVKSPANIAAMRGCVHRTYKSLAEIKRNKRYVNLKELELSIGSKGKDAWAVPYWELQEMERLSDNEDGVKRDGLVELWEYWGQYRVGGEFVSYLIVVANGDTVIRMEENFYDDKFLPFVAAVNTPRDNEFYGVPELIPVRGLIKEETALRNARLDSVNLNINPMLIVDRAAGIKPQTLVSRPGGVIWANDVNGAKPFLLPEPPGARDVEMLTFEIQNTVGASSGQAANQAAKSLGRSATGAAFIQQQNDQRIAVKVRLLSESFIKPLARIMFSTNKQFVTDAQWARVSDPQKASVNPFTQILPDAFQCRYDFEVATAIDSSPELEYQKLSQFIQLAGVIEQTQPGTINWQKWMEDAGRSLLGRRSRNYIRSDQERMALQQQQLAAEQAANAQVGMMAPQPNGGGVNG